MNIVDRATETLNRIATGRPTFAAGDDLASVRYVLDRLDRIGLAICVASGQWALTEQGRDVWRAINGR
jgi:hypothetical protein